MDPDPFCPAGFSGVHFLQQSSGLIVADDYLIDEDYPMEPTLKKTSSRHTGGLCSNLPKRSIPIQIINVDSKVPFCYPDEYCFRLIYVSICWATDEADTQFTIYVSFALRKQYLIVIFIFGTNDSFSYNFPSIPFRFLRSFAKSCRSILRKGFSNMYNLVVTLK